MTAVGDLRALRVNDLWSFLVAQNLAYWATCAYLIVEYVRPQQLFVIFEGWPLGQVALGAALVGLLISGQLPAVKGLTSWLLLAFTAVIVLSSFGAFDPEKSFSQWRLWFSWVVIYFLIVNVIRTRQQFFFFLLLWLLSHYYMSQGGAKQFAFRGFTFDSYGVVGAPGWFQNSGEFGIAMCMFVPVAWHFYLACRKHLTRLRMLFVIGMPITATLSVLGSSSRGALLGLGVVALWSVLLTKHRVRAIVGTLVIGTMVWVLMPKEFTDRFESAGDDYTSQTRMTFWKAGLDMAQSYPVLGIGYGNWLPFYDRYFRVLSAAKNDPTGRLQLSHNIFIQCVAELGFLGLGVFLALIYATFRLNGRTRALARAGPGPPDDFLAELARGLDGALIGYVVSGFFVTVLYYPFFWINLALTTALHIVALNGVRAPAPVRVVPRQPVTFRGSVPRLQR